MIAAKVVLDFRDNNGRKASTQVRLDPDWLSSQSGSSFALALALVVSELSNAALYRYRIVYEFGGLPEPGKPSLSSDCNTRLLLFFRNEGAAGSISIPSPSEALPYDASDAYRAARLTREALLLHGMLGHFQGILSGAVLTDGRPFPNDFIVGTLNRNQL